MEDVKVAHEPAEETLPDRVRVALEEKGCQVTSAESWADVTKYIGKLAGTSGSVALAAFPLAEEATLGDRLNAEGLSVLSTVACTREEILSASVGITAADAVVAETGTIFLVENEGDSRFVSNMPPIHIALVVKEAMASTVTEGLKKVRRASQEKYGVPLANYVTAISGPSRTADIEFKMAFGMHGPKEVHVILLEGDIY
ncbi:lactate utilization protein [Metallumcola ferriviriculae]|uniref:Lactate utilization protein n=1 Tax=Metallumcola ferriviriculae TaxID=3039180 RepID=A0AAU0UMX4_9FIRM|nr:lactate utilization protein [Desulfitibacteraceae bacterium MK1]